MFIRCILIPFVAVAALGAPTVRAEEPLADLSWLGGCWLDAGAAGDTNEECWMCPAAGTLLGVSRGIGADGGVFFEFLRIAVEDGEAVYFASPRGRSPATPFRRTLAEPRRAVFENPEHDFPQRLEYWLAADGTLHAKVEGERGGKPSGFELTWRRVEDSEFPGCDN